MIVRTDRETGEFISPIFLRERKDGSHRMILNLKALNKSIVYHHFKMDTLGSVIKLMRPNCFMATIDLKDAYYSVPVSEKHQKYLKFGKETSTSLPVFLMGYVSALGNLQSL